MPHISNRSSDVGTGMIMRHACQVGASRVKRGAQSMTQPWIAAARKC
jgi:hypothetical protein